MFFHGGAFFFVISPSFVFMINLLRNFQGSREKLRSAGIPYPVEKTGETCYLSGKLDFFEVFADNDAEISPDAL